MPVNRVVMQLVLLAERVQRLITIPRRWHLNRMTSAQLEQSMGGIRQGTLSIDPDSANQ